MSRDDNQRIQSHNYGYSMINQSPNEGYTIQTQKYYRNRKNYNDSFSSQYYYENSRICNKNYKRLHNSQYHCNENHNYVPLIGYRVIFCRKCGQSKCL